MRCSLCYLCKEKKTSKKISVPYVVKKEVGDLVYSIAAPDRRKAVQVCHINMLKPY